MEASYAHKTGTGQSQAYRLEVKGRVPSGKNWLWNFRGNLGWSNADHWGFDFSCSPQTPGRFGFGGYYGETRDYRPSVGFFPEPNSNTFGVYLDYFDRNDKGTVLYWGGNVSHNWRRFLGGPKKGQLLDRGEFIGFFVTGRKGWDVFTGYNRYQRPPFHDRTFTVSFGWNVFDRFRWGGASYRWGKRAGKSYGFLTFNQSLRTSDRWSLNLSYEQLWHEQRTYQLVISSVYDLTPERSLVFRWVKGSTPKPGEPKTLLPIDNFYLGFRQFSRKGLDIYLLLGDPNARSTRFMLLAKLIRVF